MKIKANGNAIQNEVTNPHRSFGRTYGEKTIGIYLPRAQRLSPHNSL